MNVCFITNELHPFRPGGIGRLMYNFAVANRERGAGRARFFFLVSSAEVPDLERLARFYAEHDLGTVVGTPPGLAWLGEPEAALFGAVAPGYDSAAFVRKSMEYYNGLLCLEQRFGVRLDLIEFPDYGGWGFASIAARRAGLAFGTARIALRLHSTGGIIHEAEPFYHRRSRAERGFFELERQCLQQCDLVVSHLEVITRANSRLYGCDEQWRARVLHEFPPIFLEPEELQDVTDRGLHADFVFSSRIQPFKRPDLFVRAAVLFLDRNPDYQGRFFVASYGWDRKYIEWLRALVPARHAERVPFLLNAEATLRNNLLAGAVVIVPSNYESLCVFAYESALRGCRLILNRSCLAFSAGGYWDEGRNCLFFDGTAEHLAEVCERALQLPAPEPLPLPESSPYWTRPAEWPAPRAGAGSEGRLALVAWGFDTLADVNATLIRLAPLRDAPWFELHLVVDRALGAHLAPSLPAGVHCRFAAWPRPNPGYFARLVGDLDTDYIAFQPPGVEADPAFYELARVALDRNPGCGAVSTHVREPGAEEGASSEWQQRDRDKPVSAGTLRVTLGAAPTAARYDLYVLAAGSCVRTELVRAARFHEEAGDYFLPLLMRGIVEGGADVITLPRVMISESPQGAGTAYLDAGAVLDAP